MNGGIWRDVNKQRPTEGNADRKKCVICRCDGELFVRHYTQVGLEFFGSHKVTHWLDTTVSVEPIESNEFAEIGGATK